MRKATLAGGVAAVGAIAMAVAGTATAQQESSTPHASGPTVAHACAHSAKPGVMSCFAEIRTDIKQPKVLGAQATPQGYGPSDLQSAYGLPADGGAGQTVAIVDAQDDPNAEADVNAYRQQYGLGSADFEKVNQDGSTSSLPTPDSGWAEEESLDLDMVSAIAPKAKILLVEANSASTDDLGAAENTAVKLGAKFVSNSWGGAEDSSQTSADQQYFTHPGVAITASSGDNGYGASWPATSENVVGVGGTSLSGSNGSYSETAWSGAGSGCSAYESKPQWQTSATGCDKKAVADVSAVADPNTGLAVYDTYQQSGWLVVGGTSASSPIIASVFADAGTPGASDEPANYVWQQSDQLTDVTSGSNGTCDTQQWCNAGQGWDGPTGLGTPKGLGAFKPTSG